MLQRVRQDTNRYCGPAAISAIAGIWTSEAAKLLRDVTERRKIICTTPEEVLTALRMLGYQERWLDFPEGETLGQWLNVFAFENDRLYLISAGCHWQVVDAEHYVCGKTILPISHKNPFVPRKAKIKGVWEIKEATAL